MKKRINLFSKKKQQEPIPTMSQTIRSYGILFLCVCMFLSSIAGGYYFYQQQILTKVTNNVDSLKQVSRQNDKIEGNIVFFINKKEQLKTFLKDDAEFEKYYSLLQGVLADSKTDATLQSMNLTLDKSTTFVITFKEFSTAEKLLTFIESPSFLSNFDSLSLASFNISNSSATTAFQLNFRGTFVKKLKTKQ